MRSNLQKQALKSEILLLNVALAWGIGFPVMKVALNYYDVFTVLWLRFALATLIMLPFAFKLHKSLDLATLKVGIILGLLLFTTFIFLMLGLNYTTASNTGFITGLAIVWVPLLLGLIQRKPIHHGVKISMVLGLVGLFILANFDSFQLHIGDILVLIGSLVSSIQIIVLDKLAPRHNSTLLTTIQIITVAFLSLLVSLCLPGETLPKHFNVQLISALIITAVFATAFAFWVQTTYQSKTTPERAALIYNLEPVFAAVFAMLILGEKITMHVLIGGGFIFAAMIISNLFANKD